MSGKRPGDVSMVSSAAKKARTETSLPPNPAQVKAALDIAAKRAEIQAKLAAMKAKLALPPTPAAPTPPRTTASTGMPNLDPDLARKVAEAKRLVESMQAKHRVLAGQAANPYLSGSSTGVTKPAAIDPAIAARGGLAMAAHPLLLDMSKPAPLTKRDRYDTAPKFATATANSRLPPPRPSTSTAQPDASTSESDISTFFDPRLSYGTAAEFAPRATMGKGQQRDALRFNQPGKYVRQGEALRAEAKMEDLKRRIMESARKAGLENEMEMQGKVIKRAAPPEIEWWDAPFLPEKSYDSYSADYLDNSGLITIYIQHPIQIPAPSDKIKVEPKALFLTKQELKKMRRQRRMAELKDRQDRVKMGLLAPDPPKIKLSNMMRVLTQDAISDPTKIEAQVRREMAVRSNGHIKMNKERKLTDEERRAKKEDAKVKDEQKGIGAMCFRVRYLSDPAHKSKVRNNANQDGLTGAIIYNPRTCLVIVEGGMKGLKHFKHFMLNRLDWTEEARSRPGDDLGKITEEVETIKVDGEEGEETVAPIDLANNTCSLIWEGTHRERMFRGLRQYNAPTNADAKEALGNRFEGLFDLALKADDAEE